MGKNRISKTILLNVGLVIAVIMLGVGAFFVTRAESGGARDFVLTGEGVASGDYVTADGAHKISVVTGEGGSTTISYFDTAAPETTYALTASTTAAVGVGTTTLTGNIGTSSTAVTFVMLNENAMLCVSHIKYTTASGNVILYGYTPFVKTYTPTADASGVIEVWRNGAKVSAFANFQDAFTFAQNNDTLRLKSNFLATEGAALVGKNLTIEGGNYLLDKSQWANTVFAVAENAQLAINNLDIDGGATNWVVGFDDITYTNSSIPLATGSADNDPKTSYPAVTTKGKLFANNLNISNIYSSTAEGIGLFVAKGGININNSVFSHLASTLGGAMRIGLDIIEDSLDSYPVESVVFNSVDFTHNYARSWGGGAIYIGNLAEGSFEDCNFDTNAVSGSFNGGGAICMYAAGHVAHSLGLPYGKMNINNSIFNNNWAGNDGYAIENYDMEFTITNTKFTGNIGVSRPNGSVGTFSCLVERDNYRFAVQIFKNCIFENNQGPCSCIGDHATNVDIRIIDTQFKNNSGNCSVLMYTGVGEIDNCTFENEQATEAVIETPMYNGDSIYTDAGLTGPSLTIKDTTFTGTPDGVDDISMRKQSSKVDTAAEPKIIIKGETKANISMRHGAELDVDGTLDGSVTCAVDTPSDTNVTVGANGSIMGGVVQYYDLTITYPTPDDDTESVTGTITVAGGITSSHAIETLLGVSKENHTLALYTDSACTTAWDYNCDGEETLYGIWEWSVTINYYDQGAVRFTGTHGAAFSQSHLNGRKTILDTPTKGGYIFEGWYLGDSTCSDESKKVTELSADVDYESISLYAKWRAFVQTITLSCQNFTTQQYMVYVFIGDDLVMQVKPTETTTLTLSRVKNYDKPLRICFVYGYYGKIEYTSLTGAKASGRSVKVSLVENAQINYKITTPNVNSSIIV